MRDLDGLFNSLVNIDRDSLVAILSSEAEAAERLANSIRTRTSTQRLKRQQAVERAARIKRVLLFFQHNEVGSHMVALAHVMRPIHRAAMAESGQPRGSQDVGGNREAITWIGRAHDFWRPSAI